MNIEIMLLICSDYYYLQKNNIYNINEKEKGFYKVAWPDVDLKKTTYIQALGAKCSSLFSICVFLFSE